jgi:hypothetical protein
MPTVEERTAYTAGLRRLADLLDTHPDCPLPYLGPIIDGRSATLDVYTHGRDELAAAARALGGRKIARHDGKLGLVRDLDGLRVVIVDVSGEVCEQVVVGQEVEAVPDPQVVAQAQAAYDDAVASAPKVRVERDVTEWRCPPSILAPREREPAGAAA